MNSVLKCEKALEDFCTGCGLCVSLCPKKCLSLEQKNGAWRPTMGKKEACISCGACERYCAGLQEKVPYKLDKPAYYGHSNDETLRAKAASGGLLTEIMSFLLDSGRVDCVAVADQYHNDHNASFRLVRHSNELAELAGSNYCPVPMGLVLDEIMKNEGCYAIVCLPCLANSLCRLQVERKVLRDRISYIFALLCNHVPTYYATDYTLLKHHADIKSINLVKYRGEGWFGQLRGYHEHLLQVKIPFANYYTDVFCNAFWQRACTKCVDHFGSGADICFGDADFIKLRGDNDNIGESTCFIHTERGHDIINEIRKTQRIALYEGITEEEINIVYGPLTVKSQVASTAGNTATKMKIYLLSSQLKAMISIIKKGYHTLKHKVKMLIYR